MKNQREIYTALLEGETLINDAHFTVKLKEDGNLGYDEDRIMGGVFNAVFKCIGDWQIYKEPKWYENISDGGVLCWVSDDRRDVDYCSQPIIIDHYYQNKYVEPNDTLWVTAKPLTKQEIQVFKENAPDE